VSRRLATSSASARRRPWRHRPPDRRRAAPCAGLSPAATGCTRPAAAAGPGPAAEAGEDASAISYSSRSGSIPVDRAGLILVPGWPGLQDSAVRL